ncbi:MAG: hypothetical protein ACYDCK_11390 [Thermoplasmatota archaeon]
MPTYYKVLGAVEISTAIEKPNLDISLTRDRLVPSRAFTQLREVVRASLHWYGMLRTKYEGKTPGAPAEHARTAMQSLRAALREYKEEIEPQIWTVLDEASRDALKAARDRERALAREVALLGGLATAGVATIAYHNEVERQLAQIEHLVETSPGIPDGVTEELRKWAAQARTLRKVFSHLTHRENLDAETELGASRLVGDVEEQLSFALKGLEIQKDIPRGEKLARASYIEWTSIFQLLFGSAADVARQTGNRSVEVRLSTSGGRRVLDITVPRLDRAGGDSTEGLEFYTENLADPTKTGLAIIRAMGSSRGWACGLEDNPNSSRKVSISWKGGREA